VEVRKTAVTILTHLILNDMLKVKGQISEMAICLEDKQEKISSSAKRLFSELARKVSELQLNFALYIIMDVKIS